MQLSPVFLLVFCFFAAHASSQTDYVLPGERVDCIPAPGYSKEECVRRGCIYDDDYAEKTGCSTKTSDVCTKDDFERTPKNVPRCYYPQRSGYTASEATDNSAILRPGPEMVPNPYGTNFDRLQFTSASLGAAVKVQITPVDVPRFVPPVPINSDAQIESTEKLIVSQVSKNDRFSFTVTRKSTGVNIWDTSIGGLQFADQFIQIATYLPTKNIYGFGETIHHTLRHQFKDYETWGMFSRDHPPDTSSFEPQNLYSVHPFYLGLEADGKAHGVFIFNSNAQEVTIGLAPHLVYRTIGGQLDIFFFPGPTPEDVIQQYHQVIGTPFLPAYWALGFQICRWGYNGTLEVEDVVNRQLAAGIPQDVQYADIEYMHRRLDFTYDANGTWKDWPAYTNTLHDMGKRVILIFDPAIEVNYETFERAVQQNANFVSWPRADLVMRNVQDLYPTAYETLFMFGVVWPDNHVVFPDFLDPTNKTQNWWIDEFVRYHQKQAYDGIWIDMNEPANFGTNEENPWYFGDNIHNNAIPLKCPLTGADASLDAPPYLTWNAYQWNEPYLSGKTLCMLGTTSRNTTNQYHTHSLYGWSESVATYAALNAARGKRGAVISRSTFPSSGRYTGHWLGDNTSRWPDLRSAIIGVMEFNFFGIPYVGSDICGFIGNATEELCLRWQQVGAFHPFMRNHNNINETAQDPAQWPSVAAATRKANLFRYRHLPYLFTLHFNVSLNGGTVIRPLFFEFPQDENTYDLSHQFLWGDALLVIPVIEPGVVSVQGYVPTNAVWYSLYDHNYGTQVNTGHVTLSAPTTSLIPVLLRGGRILPRQVPALSTDLSRQNPMQLVVAVEPQNGNEQGSAYGELFWDDGEAWVDSIETHNYHHFQFNFTTNPQYSQLTIVRDHTGHDVELTPLENIEILGLVNQPDLSTFSLNGQAVTVDEHSYYAETHILNVTSSNLINLNEGSTWNLQWKNL